MLSESKNWVRCNIRSSMASGYYMPVHIPNSVEVTKCANSGATVYTITISNLVKISYWIECLELTRTAGTKKVSVPHIEYCRCEYCNLSTTFQTSSTTRMCQMSTGIMGKVLFCQCGNSATKKPRNWQWPLCAGTPNTWTSLLLDSDLVSTAKSIIVIHQALSNEKHTPVHSDIGYNFGKESLLHTKIGACCVKKWTTSDSCICSLQMTSWNRTMVWWWCTPWRTPPIPTISSTQRRASCALIFTLITPT